MAKRGKAGAAAAVEYSEKELREIFARLGYVEPCERCSGRGIWRGYDGSRGYCFKCAGYGMLVLRSTIARTKDAKKRIDAGELVSAPPVPDWVEEQADTFDERPPQRDYEFELRIGGDGEFRARKQSQPKWPPMPFSGPAAGLALFHEEQAAVPPSSPPPAPLPPTPPPPHPPIIFQRAPTSVHFAHDAQPRPPPRPRGWFSRHRYGLISLAVIVVALKVYLANHAKRSSADDDEPDVATTASAKKKTAASVPSAASAKPAPKAPPTPPARAPVKAAPPKASASASVVPSASPSATASAPPTEYGE